MKQMNKLAAAVAMALGMGVMAPSANAIVYDDNGIGDTLIFPVYNGYVDNYYTISNNSANWIQGHLRFRGAAWTAEVRDFDVILSPGDVFVFRLTDLVADSALIPWEIDQSLDPKNFAYTGMTTSCGSVADCMEPDDRLIEPACPPTANAPATTEECVHQATVGYVEFFGEAVLDGMTQDVMASLLNAGLADSSPWKPYQDDLYAGYGTNAWRWSDAPSFDACPGDADGNGRCDRGLSDVGNVLSGTAFIVIPGRSQGLAYNAEAFVNFRTASGWGTHRIDNYRVDYPNSRDHMAGNGSVQATADSAVILHDESGADGNGPSPFGDYVYHFIDDPSPDDREDEIRISFNNTWGPTLADGDDYSAVLAVRGQRHTEATAGVGAFDGDLDDWETIAYGTHFLPPVLPSRGNSIGEVEEAIREKGQYFTTYYFDGASLGGNGLSTWFFTHFPTKFYYGENRTYYNQTTLDGYIRKAVERLLGMGKPVTLEIWDINEVPGGQSRTGCISPDPCAIQTDSVLGYELNFYGIPWFKSVFNTGTASGFTSGRVVVHPTPGANNPMSNPDMAWPMDSFAFEAGGYEVLGQWRSMNQGMDMHGHLLQLP